MKYLELYESNQKLSYESLAKKFGVTRARICQMIALVKKLPPTVTNHFLDDNNADNLCHITERELRPLTLMKNDAEKIRAFDKLYSSD